MSVQKKDKREGKGGYPQRDHNARENNPPCFPEGWVERQKEVGDKLQLRGVKIPGRENTKTHTLEVPEKTPPAKPDGPGKLYPDISQSISA